MAITPEQIPALIEQNKGAIEAITRVLEQKRAALALIDQMEDCLAGSDLTGALIYMAKAQKIEYAMTISGLEEKLKQHQSMLHQLENPISIPTVNVPPMPNLPNMGKRGRG